MYRNNFTSGSSTEKVSVGIQISALSLEKGQVMNNRYSMIYKKIMDPVFKRKKCLKNCKVVKSNDDRKLNAK